MSTVKAKVVLLGDSGVGKTSLIKRFVLDQFDDAYVATVGGKVTRKDLVLPGPGGRVDLALLIWDIIGREGYTTFQARTLAGARGAILVADLTREDTVANLERHWIPLLFKVAKDLPLVFAANKADLEEDRAFGPEDLGPIASRYNIDLAPVLPPGLSTHRATSARTGKGVQELFEALGHLIVSGKAPRDPIKELYESLVALEISRFADKRTPIGALDAILVDFCEQAEGTFEDDATPLTILRQEFARASVDVSNPTREGLLRAVDYLAEAESEFHEPASVEKDRQRRLEWISSVRW